MYEDRTCPNVEEDDCFVRICSLYKLLDCINLEYFVPHGDMTMIELLLLFPVIDFEVFGRTEEEKKPMDVPVERVTKRKEGDGGEFIEGEAMAGELNQLVRLKIRRGLGWRRL